MYSNPPDQYRDQLQSIWSAVTSAGPSCPTLDAPIDTDVVIIGGGFTGLSTALSLRKAGVHVTVLEAAEPGWGGSGRNNGQVIPTLSRPDPDDIEARHGEAGERFVHLIRDSASILFDAIREHGIQAEAEQAGWMQPVHSPGRIKIAERRVKQWSARGADVELFDQATARAMTGSDAWYGGFLNKTGGHINPLALSRGLAHAVIVKGGSIYAGTPALRFERKGDKWVVHTPTGQVSARALVLATNAYTGEFSRDLAPQVARQVVPVLSWQMATKPLPDAVRPTVIPGRQALSDTHGELYFMRYDARNRLITGGNMLMPYNRVERLQRYVGERLQRLWPQIGPVGFDYVWNGYVGMTDDFMPRFHRLGPDAWGWAGCNGRAAGLAVALGQEFAKAVTGTPENELAMPFTQPRPIAMHGIVRHVATVMLLRYRRLDRKEI